MKKILFLMVMFAICFPTASIEASTIHVNATVDEKTMPFDVQLLDVNKILNSNVGKLDFQTKINQTANVGSWKLRAWCNEGIKLGMSKDVDVCGKAIVLTTEQIKTFSLFLTNPTGKHAEFSFKLKSYNKNGKWIYSDKEAFMW